jgi:hypothetical protein
MQNALTVILKIKSGATDDLRQFLLKIGNDIQGNSEMRLAASRLTHFSRYLIFDNDTRLLYTACYDGPLDAYLRDLLQKFQPALVTIFSHCEGFPSPQVGSFSFDFIAFINKNAIPANMFFAAYPGRTVEEVTGHIGLRAAFETLLNTDTADSFLGALSRIPIISPKPQPLQTFLNNVVTWPVSTLLGMVYPLILSIIAPKISKAPASTPGLTVHAPYSLTEREKIVQNELTVIATIRPEYLPNLKRVLGLLHFSAQVLPSDGTLSGVSTIHFARWVILDDGKTLLFESNYDGTWEAYIGEFIDRAASGMDAIWGCCVGYPERGAKDIQGFKTEIIDHQVRAELFYSAYPHTSVKNILNDIHIGETVGEWLGVTKIADLLRRL